ncbi:hypothetical protein ZWY2020_045328 [Hordeum vulgare]|nr:hypothetical protein ZWY2020_045328 [Hordeum vulgare]
MEGARAAELAGDVQIKGGQAAQPLPQDQQQQLPTGSEAVEMPATPLPHAREIEWSEHFSFFNSIATATGTGELASVGMSRSESSRPDSVTQQQQQQRCLEDERVEELTVRNCISSEAQQPAASAGGSTSSSGERPAVMRGLWGNFTRMAWRTADAASREALAVSRGDIANMRNGDLVGRENLAVSLGNGMGSQNIDASAKEMPFGRGENAKPDMAADDVFNRKRCFDQKTLHQECNGNGHSILKYRKVGEQGSVAVRRPIHPFRTDHKVGNQSDGADLGALGQKFGEPYYGGNASYGQRLPSYGNQESVLELRMLEDSWYRSPEELNQLKGTFPANIYSLGVLLFELFSCCETWELHCAAMSDLRHRILPPSFLSESPKEAGFCLWLLHPDPFSRPKARDILGCDLINEGRDLSLLDKAPAAISEEDTESGLLLNFLSQLKEEKETQAAKLSADLSSLQTDIVEAERRHSLRMGFSLEDMDVPASSNDVPGTSSNALRGASLSGLLPPSGRSDIYEERVMKNLQQLENAYYSTRSTIDTSETNVIKRSDNDALRVRENFNHSDDDAMAVPTDRLGCFFDGLCKYARHSRFEVRGILKNADILNSPNVICSLSFDRDEEYFAAAGVSKKIKIFEFDALLNDRVDIHYPIVEMPSKSKLSCVCWNNYIKNYLASTDYDGTVQLWDASTGQGFTQFTEHRKRAWSVSFSEVDPTKLASGSDDCCVKVWNINQKNSIDTIRNVANVCCVQFSPYSSRMLAFGSADYKTYCYDLRHTRIPWCTISGHGKAVSYVRFLDAETLISASTDNTLKIWDLNRTNPNGLSTNACSLTLSGHTNEKNFVGLSVHDGYITCGSENNEVYSYYKSFPMPITSHKFGSIDPITGQETNDDNQQFVSSVCWRGRSNMVVAANSSGSIKVLELV